MSIKKKLFLNIKDYKFNSLFIRNMFIIFLAIAIPLNLICYAMYYISNSNAMSYAYQTNQEMCNTIRDITDTLMEQMCTLAINTSLKSEVNRLMLFPEDNSERDSALVEYIKNFLFMYDYLSSMYLYCNSNQKLISREQSESRFEDIDDPDWYEAYRQIQNDEILIFFRKYKNIYPYYLTIIKPVYTTDTNNAGAVILNIDIKRLCNVYKKTGRSTRQEILLVDKDGMIIYSEDNKRIAQNAMGDEITAPLCAIEEEKTATVRRGNENFVVSHLRSENYGWHYYFAMPMDFYYEGFQKLMLTMLVMIILSLVLGVVISAYISFKVFTPIESIMEVLDDSTPWLKLQERENKNETDYILRRIVSTQQANRTLIDERDKKIMILKHAQTMMLQLQINPHFLGNTLNAINWMAIEMTMGENKVSQAINKLAKLFNAYSDATDYITDLNSEIEHTKQYIDILNFRYPDAFQVVWDIDEKAQIAKIPRITLQPLVENAVYHGIKPLSRKGTVTVRAFVKSSILTIVVKDDGIGMSREKMNALNTEFLNDYVFYDGHIGLKNVNQRFKLIYGNEYGLRLEKTAGGGVMVVLQEPYMY